MHDRKREIVTRALFMVLGQTISANSFSDFGCYDLVELGGDDLRQGVVPNPFRRKTVESKSAVCRGMIHLCAFFPSSCRKSSESKDSGGVPGVRTHRSFTRDYLPYRSRVQYSGSAEEFLPAVTPS